MNEKHSVKYIALLRGVNVGGNNIISMSQLKEAFAEHGFTDVSSYINSGNILFSSEKTDEAALKAECELLINHKFNLEIIVSIISSADINAAIKHAPEWWGDDKDVKHNAIFVIPPATPEALIEQVGVASEYEKLYHYGQVIFWSAPIKTYSKTRWSKIVGTPAYKSVTIRNANSARKLAALTCPE